jgi:sulfhydrogenase subunit gamma (sulfur reductase)
MDRQTGIGYYFREVQLSDVRGAMEPSAAESLYLPREAEIIAVTRLTPDEKLFTLKMIDAGELHHLPGQFIQLSLLGFTEAPISVASSPTRKGHFDLAIRNAGFLTAEMHHKRAGDRVGIRGPFGTPFTLAELRGHNLLLISGGCGLAPLRSLIQYCEDCPDEFGSLQILYGARNADYLLFQEDLAAWQRSPIFSCALTVDAVKEGSCFDGSVGLITALIPPLAIDPATTCAVVVGPPLMYRAVIDELRRKGLPEGRIVLSLERQMRCGVGKCGHCTIDHLYCCSDGPVFRLDQLAGVRGAI